MEAQIRKLRRTVDFHTMVVILGVVLFAGFNYLSCTVKDMYKLKTQRNGDQLEIRTISDGPFVVTHVVASDELHGRSIAAIDPPLGIIDSGGGTVESLSKLVWYDTRGERVKPPGEDSEIRVLYVNPEVSKLPDMPR